ncbi:NAD(P)/FAD-dependent oxidoreductase [Actinomadura macra]|uniref:NAD(P)/FAD-dependent oxidoreductase n=1 Tax=Actinomadura macra TaxID=46164 RepID=UPI00082A3B78|nr:FAD-dependent oxidoreductase [Actinomadura macra]
MKRYDFALVGGGIIGACVAEELAAIGASVTVLDAGPEPGHATRHAVGVAVPPLRHVADHVFYDWMRQAAHGLREDIDRLEPEYGQFSAPHAVLHVLRARNADRMAPDLETAGAGSWIEPARAAELAAGLRLPGNRRYLLDETGFMVDGARYLAAVRARCAELDVDWRQHTTVWAVKDTSDLVELATSGGTVHADITVVTAGAWSGKPELTGHVVPVGPRRRQLVTLATETIPPLILSANRSLVPGLAGDVIVGATDDVAEVDAGFDDRCDVAGITRLLRFATAVMPTLSRAVPVDLRAGLCSASASGWPLIGRVPGRQRLWLATGHAGHGLLTARYSARGLLVGLTKEEWDTVPWFMCPRRALEGKTCASTM